MIYKYLILKNVPTEELKQYRNELIQDIKKINNEKLKVDREIKRR